FMEDGYSKNVMLLRADGDDSHKILNGVLLRQYRKYVAKGHGVDVKPVILFKSNKIAKSLAPNETYLDFIRILTIDHQQPTINTGFDIYEKQRSIWSKMFAYYKKMDLNEVIRDLQWDFVEGNMLNANSRDFLSEENALLLNSLEEPNNPIRAIFAVARL